MSEGRNVDNIFGLRNVTMNFGNVVAIQDVAFEIAHGEIVGLVGDNGPRDAVQLGDDVDALGQGNQPPADGFSNVPSGFRQ